MNNNQTPASQLPSDCGNDVDENKKPTPTEQKIMIAGSFDTEKIKAIRELMEEEAKEYAHFIIKKIVPNLGAVRLPNEENKLYQLFQQSKK